MHSLRLSQDESFRSSVEEAPSGALTKRDIGPEIPRISEPSQTGNDLHHLKPPVHIYCIPASYTMDCPTQSLYHS